MNILKKGFWKLIAPTILFLIGGIQSPVFGQESNLKSFYQLIQEAKDILVISVARVDGPQYGQKAIAKIDKSLKGKIRQRQIELPFLYRQWPQNGRMVTSGTHSKDLSFAAGKSYLVLVQMTDTKARRAGNPLLAKTAYEPIPTNQYALFDLAVGGDFVQWECAELLKISRERNAATRLKLLSAMLGNTNPTLRADAADAVADFNTREACDLLLKALKSDSSPLVRGRIARRLSGYTGDQVMQTLITAARLDEVSDVREAAILSLSKQGSKDAVPALLALYPNSNDKFKLLILSALQALSDPNALSSLINFFGSAKDVQTKIAILDAVSTIPTLDAPRFCIRVIDSQESVSVKMAAVHAVGASGFSELFPKLTEFISRPCTGNNRSFELLLIDALYKLGKPEMMLPVLRDYLSCSDNQIRKRAVMLMGTLKLKTAIAILQGHLKNETDSEVRAEVTNAIGRLNRTGR
jgi:HEAT repeat protein